MSPQSKIENLKWVGDSAERAGESGSGDQVTGDLRLLDFRLRRENFTTDNV
jgi:hypothetical protein